MTKMPVTGDRYFSSEKKKKKKKAWWLQELPTHKKLINRTLTELSVCLHIFLLYSQLVNVPFIPAFNTSLACTIFIKTCVKINALYNCAKVQEEKDK